MTDSLQSENLLPLLLQHLRAGVVIHAPDTRILFANAHASQLLGLTMDQLTGKYAFDPVWTFLREDGSPMPPEEYPVRRVLASRQPLQDLLIGVDRPATRDQLWALVNAFPEFTGQENPGRIVVTFVDITERKRAEDHLRAISRMQSIILDNSTVGITLVRNRVQVWANPRMAELFGIPLERLQGISTRILYADDASFDMVATQAYPLLAQGQKAAYEIQMKKGDGTLFWCRFEGKALDPANPHDGSIWICEDITERKCAETDIRSAKAFLDSVIDMSPIATWIADKDGTITRVNRSLCEAIHLPAGKIVGHYHVLRDVNLETQGVMPQVRAVFEEHRPVRFSIPWKAAQAGQVDFTGARDLFIDVSMFPILDAQRRLSHVVCQWVDITERKRAEEALRESEERFRTLVDRAPEGIFVHSGGRILFVNPAIVHLLGASGPHDLIDTDFLRWVAPEFHDAIRERIRLQRDAGAPSPPMVQECLRLDGSRIPVETEAVPFRFQDRDAHLVFVRDITARLKAEAQRETLQTQLLQAQKMDSIGRLAGGVAHDFNNMLGVILGHADLALVQIDPSQPFLADIQEIQKAAKRSADLTRQLLAFARKQTVAPRILDLNETIEGMLKMLRRLIGENIDLAWHPAKTPNWVMMDPTQIDQILANLCVNARDAIGETGKVTIETEPAVFDGAYCAAHPGFSPGDFVLLAVSDDGCGMDSETLLHVFEPFFTTKKVGEGSGLGLATVYGIVKQNRGFINIYSEKGHGTTFKIYLPRHAADDAPAPPPQAPQPIARGSETILLVEDEPMLLNMTRMMLEHAGYHVLPAALPADALRLAGQHAGVIHLLMTDVVMPEMNGRDLASALQARHPRLKRLFMSGYTANVIAHHGILDPGVHFIQKPFSASALAAKIRETLDAPAP